MPAAWKRKIWEVLAALLLVGAVAAAQQALLAAAPKEPASVDDVLHGMTARAGVIFVGTVVEVRHRAPPSGSGGAGVVEVEFAVDQAVRGVRAGSHYVLREWGGLWQGNEERYRTGERRLMLLHPPGAAGLSSPVDGMDGAIPIRPGAKGAAEPLADLRWVATRVSRGPVQYRPETPRIPRARAMAEVLHLPGEVTAVAATEEPAAFSPASSVPVHSVPAQCASVTSVLAKIVAWGAETP